MILQPSTLVRIELAIQEQTRLKKVTFFFPPLVGSLFFYLTPMYGENQQLVRY
jgi:hypothetical protein